MSILLGLSTNLRIYHSSIKDRHGIWFDWLPICSQAKGCIVIMASMTTTLGRWPVPQNPIISKSTETQTRRPLKEEQTLILPFQTPISRRFAILTPLLSITLISLPPPSLARGRRSRKTILLEDYLTNSDGLKYYDIDEGKGPVAVKGSLVQVHFDCVYRNITAVSSRESKLLAGNRIIAQPYIFKVGAPPGRERKREFVDNPNGLFSAQAAPKPPPVLYSIVEGMKLGGKRTVIVPPEVGYGQKGSNEIPPGATFELNIELLQVTPPEGSS